MKIITLLPGKIKYIHVNQHHIRANIKDKGKRKVITVKCGKANYYANDVTVDGIGIFKYNPVKAILSCGARLVFMTKDKVVITIEGPE